MSDIPSDPEPQSPKVIVIDDDSQVLEELSGLFRNTNIPFETYVNCESFLEKFEPQRTACLIVDVRLPGIDGLELQQKLNVNGETIPMIITSAFADVPMVVQALKTGAIDFLEKPFDSQKLLRIVRQTLIKDTQRRKRELHLAAVERRLELLTPREYEVLDLLVEGNTTRESAEILEVSPTTIDFHRKNLLHKMDIENVVKLTRLIADYRTES